MNEQNTGSLRDRVLGILAVFLASVCIMVIELVAGRLMSRYIGQSLYTWTAVIGLILAGITLGNVLGGRFADRFRASALFASIFLFAAVAAMLIPLLNFLGGNWAWLLGCETRLRIFLHVGLTFLLPAVALGMVGPVAAKMAVDTHKGTGRALGNVYAWSAAGSIVGTFVTGYYLISAIGTALTLTLAAALLFGLGILFAGITWSRRRAQVTALSAGLPFALLALSSMACPSWWLASVASPDSAPTRTLFTRESPYALVSVTVRENLPRFRQLYLDRLPHSEVDANEATNLLAGYTWLMQGALEARFGATQAVSLLVIGGGGYALPRQVMATRPGSRVVVAEIDAVVTEAAMAACGLNMTNGLEIHHADGRQVVQALVRDRDARRPAASLAAFDCIVGDTVEYYSLPYHLATLEFVQEVAAILKPDGIYLLHVVTDRKRGGAYLGAILNTMEQVFPKVSLVALKSNPDLYSSYLFVASRTEASGQREEGRGQRAEGSGQREEGSGQREEGSGQREEGSGQEIVGCILVAHPVFRGEKLAAKTLKQLKIEANGVVLTDDHAPLEQLVEPVVRGDRRDTVRFRLTRCRAALQAGKLDIAEAEARQALAVDEGSAEAHFALANVLQQRSAWAQAVAEASRVLEIDPEIFPAQVLKGTLLAASGEVAKASEEWRAVLALRPKNLDALQGLAFAREYQDEPVEAMKAWEGILELQPDDPTAHYALARLCKRAGRTEEAARHMAALRHVDPDMTQVRPNPMPMKSVAQALENLAL